jgi:phosphoglycolate phosphatase-like HAD superfamily hydrolase
MRPICPEIVLDLDGTLIDFAERHYTCFLRAAGINTHSAGSLTQESYWNQKRIGFPTDALIASVPSANPLSTFRELWASEIESPQMLALDRLLPGAKGFLEYCRLHGIVTTLATRRRQRLALDTQLTELGIANYFARVVQCPTSEGGRGKAEAVQRQLGTKHTRLKTLWIGDSEDDFEAATSLGCQFRLVATGIRSRQYLAKLAPEAVIESLDELLMTAKTV